MVKDLKYLVSFAVPIAAVIGLVLRGPWAFFTPLFAFVLIPICEMILPVQTANLTEKQATSKANNRFFNVLLYLNLPIVYGLLAWFLWSIKSANYSTSELIGLIFSIGIVIGSNGINVAHELGHRKLFWEKFIGKILLLPSLYMHFYIEHNFGHHLHAATPEDPASAKYNQTIYSFWITSMFRQYINAWNIQSDLLKRDGRHFLSTKNDMLWYVLIQFGYLMLVYVLIGFTGLWAAVVLALTGAILLESINYIEHYGLRRNKTASGRYERVREIHSWNSNHVLGRMMLYELTRHSDHHYKSHKKYQLLDYHDISPQMPFGYPTSMVIALIPPLWFQIMNKRIPLEMRL